MVGNRECSWSSCSILLSGSCSSRECSWPCCSSPLSDSCGSRRCSWPCCSSSLSDLCNGRGCSWSCSSSPLPNSCGSLGCSWLLCSSSLLSSCGSLCSGFAGVPRRSPSDSWLLSCYWLDSAVASSLRLLSAVSVSCLLHWVLPDADNLAFYLLLLVRPSAVWLLANVSAAYSDVVSWSGLSTLLRLQAGVSSILLFYVVL